MYQVNYRRRLRMRGLKLGIILKLILEMVCTFCKHTGSIKLGKTSPAELPSTFRRISCIRKLGRRLCTQISAVYGFWRTRYPDRLVGVYVRPCRSVVSWFGRWTNSLCCGYSCCTINGTSTQKQLVDPHTLNHYTTNWTERGERSPPNLGKSHT